MQTFRINGKKNGLKLTPTSSLMSVDIVFEMDANLAFVRKIGNKVVFKEFCRGRPFSEVLSKALEDEVVETR